MCQQACARGLSKTFWPGRFELFEAAEGRILLDGAHNVEGMLGLCRNIKILFKDCKITSIISILSNKQYEQMLKIISEVSSRIIIVGINNIKKNIEVMALYNQAKEYHDNVIYRGSVRAALDYISKSGPADLACITGSLYLVGEAREILMARSKAETEKSKCVNYESFIKA
jgi:dihydrofolate synthase/folylpolyglutamate synthase